MAAYAYTATLDSATSIPMGIQGQRSLTGQIDITNYNQTTAELTHITRMFRNTPRVLLGGMSANGYHVRWNHTDKTIEAFYPTAASDQTPTVDITAAAGTEVANDVDIGEVHFLAFGR